MEVTDDELTTVKEYLRLDTDDDDSMVLLAITGAKQYIINAVGEYSGSSTAQLLMCAIAQDLYDNRTLTQSEQQQKLRQQYTYQSIILQLQMEKAISDEGATT